MFRITVDCGDETITITADSEKQLSDGFVGLAEFVRQHGIVILFSAAKEMLGELPCESSTTT